MFGTVVLLRSKGNRHTVLVPGYAPYTLRHNIQTTGFDVPMPDGSELSIRLDRKLVASLARTMKLTLSEIQEG